MPMLHDPAVRDSIRSRVQSLTPSSPRGWGKMTVDQMLWHVNELLDTSLGRGNLAPMKMPLPGPLLKMLVMTLPWPKGAPTHPDLVAGGNRYDFDAEKARCISLIDEFAARPLNAQFGDSPAFGKATGAEWSKLQVKHIGHHLKQFGA